jgi:hypothetical protein
MSTKKREKTNSKTRGASTIADLRWNEDAGADKVLNILGKLQGLGQANVKIDLSDGAGATVLFYNSNATTAFVKMGNSTVTAPTGFSDSLPLPPLQYTPLAMGDDSSFFGQAGVYAYLLVDDTYIQ